MASIASLDFLLNMNVANWNSGLTQAEARTQRFNNRVRGQFNQVQRQFAGLRGALVGAFAAAGGAAALQAIDAQLKLSQAAGIGFENFQRLGFAFEQAGLTGQQSARLFATLAERIDDFAEGSATAERTFGLLGVSLEQLQSLSPDQQLLLIFDALRMVENASQRAALSAALFGSRLSIGLGPVLAQTNQDLIDLGASIEVIDEEDARAVEVLNDSFSNLQRSVIRLLSTFSPFFSAVSSVLNVVARLADTVPGLTTAIATGLVVVVGTRLFQAFRVAITAITGAASAVASFGVAGMSSSRFIDGLTLSMANNAMRAGITGIRLRAVSAAMVSLGVAGGVASTALRAVGTAFRFALGPLGILFVALELVIDVFRYGFTDALRAWANFFIRTFNAIARGLNRFIGTSIEELEEFEVALYGVADTSQNLNELIVEPWAELPPVIEEATDAVITATDTWQEFLDSNTDVLSQYEQLAMNTFNNIGDTIADFFETGRLNLRSFVADFIRQFARIQINNALGLLLGGSSGTFLGFGGGRQFGGPVNAGQAYVVGERGPELFVPNNSGNIQRNSELNGGGGTNITINAVDTQSFEAALARDPAYISNLVQRGNRQLGIR